MNAPNYVDPPVACETTAQIVEQSGGSLVHCGEGGPVKYALPEVAAKEVKEFLGKFAAENFPPAFIARIPRGRVFGSGNVLSPDGRTIARDVSPDFGKEFNQHWLLTYGKIPRPTLIPGRTAVIATTLGSGYSHWLLEELPRLLTLTEAQDCDAVIAHRGGEFAREAITRSGFRGKVIAAKRTAHFGCDELVVPSLGRMTRATMESLDAFAGSLPAATSPSGEKIYISRAGARRRRVTNEDAMWSLLEKQGFIRLRLETLTWPEQIAAFRAARVMVAPHGAGLANLVFCRPGARVIELFHRSYVNGCYWQLAALKRLDYRPLVSAGASPVMQQLSANRLDFEADTPSVLRALTRD